VFFRRCRRIFVFLRKAAAPRQLDDFPGNISCGKMRGVNPDSIRRRPKRGHFARLVALIARGDLLHDCSGVAMRSTFGVLHAPLPANIGRRFQKNFQLRIREDDRADVLPE
jgi:hypothetical protein